MKKTALLFIAVFTSFYSLALAEEQSGASSDAQSSDAPAQEMRQQRLPSDQRPDMMGQNRMGMRGGMMLIGAHPSVIATSDGGVAVLTGSRLAKYDADLNLVKEVDLKGGPRPMDNKPQFMEMKKAQMPPPEKPMELTPSESSPAPAAPASSGMDAQPAN